MVVIQNPVATDSSGSPLDPDLALTQWAGEIVAEFETKPKLIGLTRTRTLGDGMKSVQFPVLSSLSSSYHVPGEDMILDGSYLQEMDQGEHILLVDRECVSPMLIPNLWSKISHFEDRAEYTSKMVNALVKNSDKNLARVIYQGAHVAASAVYTGHPGGYVPTVNAYTSASAILGFIQDTGQRFDENDVPTEDRFVIFTPEIKRIALASAEFRAYLDADYETGNGSIAQGTIGMVDGFKIVVSNNMPTDNFAGTTNQLNPGSEGNSYVANMSTTRLMAFQRSAAGTGISQDLSLETQYLLTRKSDFVVGSYQMSHRWLRPEACAIGKSA